MSGSIYPLNFLHIIFKNKAFIVNFFSPISLNVMFILLYDYYTDIKYFEVPYLILSFSLTPAR